MENILRWGLLFIGGFVAFLIFYDIFFRRKNRAVENNLPEENHEQDVEEKLPTINLDLQEDENEPAPRLNHIENNRPAPQADDLVILSVLAKPSCHFASYDLLQAISATGMQYGDMDIFHYNQYTDKGLITLFSLASATKPGKFDLDHMGDFTCVGLSLFMDKKSVPNAEEAFAIMLDKAEQLADDLDGEVRIGPERKPLSQQEVQQYLSAMA